MVNNLFKCFTLPPTKHTVSFELSKDIKILCLFSFVNLGGAVSMFCIATKQRILGCQISRQKIGCHI